MKLLKKAGATSNILQIFIADSSSSTGAGLTGLAYNSGSLTAYYHRDTDTTATAITLVTMTVGTFTSSGFKEIDATNMPGWYQFCPPDAALAAGAKSVGFHLKGATNMAPLPIEVQLVAFDPDDSVRAGLTALPNATAGATNGLPLSVDGSGRVDVLKVNGTSQTARDLGASVLLSPGTGTGQVDLSSGQVKVQQGTSAGQLDTSSGQVKVQSGTGSGQLDVTSGVIKANLAQILGTALTETAGQIAAGFKQFFNIGSPTSTMNTITTVTTATNLTNAPTAGDFTATMKTSLNAATPSVTVSDKTGFSLSSAGVQAIWDALTSALTTVGSIGKMLVTNLTGDIYARLGAPSGASVSADVAAVKSDTAAIKAKTDNLPASPAAVGSAMTLTAAYDAAKTAASPTDVQTKVAAELDAAGSELSSVPTTTGTLRQKINFLFQYWRNKRTTTSSTETLYKEDASTTLGTSTVSDNGTTATHGEVN